MTAHDAVQAFSLGFFLSLAFGVAVIAIVVAIRHQPPPDR